MQEVIIHVNSAEKTIENYVVKPHAQVVHIKAHSDVNYELIEKKTGYAPENIVTKRVGDDLYIAFEGSDISQPDVIIDGYYTHSGELIIGKAENGLYYNYVPESAADVDAISALDSGDMAGQALGGEGFITPLWILGDNLGFSGMELLAGAAGIGAIAAAAGGGGGGDSSTAPIDSTPEDNPDETYSVTVVAPDITKDQTPTITGETNAPDGTVVTLEITDANGDKQTVTTTVSGGSYSVEVPTALPEGDYSVSVTLTDPEGNTVDAVDLGNVVDVTAPSAPTVEIIEDSNNDGIISNNESNGDLDIVITLPEDVVVGDTLTIKINETVTQVLITQEMLDHGYSTSIAPLRDGEELSVIANITDQAGNISTDASDTVIRSGSLSDLDENVSTNEDTTLTGNVLENLTDEDSDSCH